MKNILVIGAGLSSAYLIKYLLDHAQQEEWHVTVADADHSHAQSKVKDHPRGTATAFNIQDSYERGELIARHDLVISLLPPTMHVLAARDCIRLKKHLVTASYISPEMQSLHEEALQAGVLLLNECGLDPGIDHLSAMKLIHEIREKGGTITSFHSFCGGLVSPEYDDNPWNYKFTWNPRNVVLAGQATAKYLENGELKFIPSSRIFTQTGDISIEGYGDFESYANRDSLGYIIPYGIQTASTVQRGTLRRKGYSENWNQLIRLGLTDDTFVIHHAGKLTYREFTSAFTPGNGKDRLEERVCAFLGIDRSSGAFARLQWLGLFDEKPIMLAEGTPAQILRVLLEEKWKLKKGELDMIVMYHELQYVLQGTVYEVHSSLVAKGEDEVLTAMAKTVGLPMAIAAKLLLQGKISTRGVQMPLSSEFYTPILAELEQFGIRFTEQEIPSTTGKNG